MHISLFTVGPTSLDSVYVYESNGNSLFFFGAWILPQLPLPARGSRPKEPGSTHFNIFFNEKRNATLNLLYNIILIESKYIINRSWNHVTGLIRKF